MWWSTAINRVLPVQPVGLRGGGSGVSVLCWPFTMEGVCGFWGLEGV